MKTNYRVRQKQKNFMKNVDRMVYNTSPVPISESHEKSDLITSYRTMNQKYTSLSRSSTNLFSSPVPLKSNPYSQSQTAFNPIAYHDTQYSSPTKTSSMNFLISARENELKHPESLQDKSIAQEFSNERLFRGASADRKYRLNKNPIYKIENLVEDDKKRVINLTSVSQENKDFNQFLNSFRLLQSMHLDLEINYQIARNEDPSSPSPGIGIYYQLEEALKSSIQDRSSSILKITRADFTTKFSAYSTFFREIIRGLKQKGSDNEAVLTEMM